MGYLFNYRVEVACAAKQRDDVNRYLSDKLKCAIEELAQPSMQVKIDYPVNPKPHWTDRPHQKLNELLLKDAAVFRERLASYAPLLPTLQQETLAWKNGWFEGLDAVMAYAVVATHKPKRVIEVGSGYSTTFMATAAARWSPETHLTSIDPHPRAEIDEICDEVIRQPFEDTDPTRIIEQLEANDVLFIDSSHRVFTNSDVTTLFLDVIPYLRPGVLIQVHDILLPYDYPADWNNRFYSEQYLLAAYLLGGSRGLEVFMPNYFVAQNNLAPAEINQFGSHGCSFWLRKTA